jgi:hypothetical protein
MLRLIIFSLWFAYHPVHVTLTSVNYIPETNDIKVFTKIYFDDFLLDCNLDRSPEAKDNFSSMKLSEVKIVESYISEKLIIDVNGEPLQLKVQSMKVDNNEFSINIVSTNAKKPGMLKVKNLMMTDLFNDQSNFIIVKVADFEEGVKLTPEFTEQTFKIN